MSVFSALLDKYQKYKDPVKFYRKKGMKIGEGCEIRAANFGSEPYLITIGNNVRINAGVTFVTHDGGVWVLRHFDDSNIKDKEQIDFFGKIVVGNNVHIATNAVIMPNTNIGSNCIVGCGAIVTKDVPDNSVVVGVPARVIGSIEEYEKKHMKDFVYTKKMSKQDKERFLLSHFEIQK